MDISLLPDIPEHNHPLVRLSALLAVPTLADDICAFVSHGGSIIQAAQYFVVPMGRLDSWMRSDPDRSRQYTAALIDRGEWMVSRIIQEVERLALVDARSLFDRDGKLLPVTEWPADAAAAVIGLTVKEERDPVDRSKVHTVTKIKLSDKRQALELIGKQNGLFRPTLDIQHTLSLADGLKKARTRARTLDEKPSPPRLDQGAGGGISAAHTPIPSPLANSIPISATYREGGGLSEEGADKKNDGAVGKSAVIDAVTGVEEL